MRLSKPPAGWGYGIILRPRGLGRVPDRVMFVRMLASNEGPSIGVSSFEGITVETDTYGKRIGRLHRLDHFNVNRYKVDGT